MFRNRLFKEVGTKADYTHVRYFDYDCQFREIPPEGDACIVVDLKFAKQLKPENTLTLKRDCKM